MLNVLLFFNLSTSLFCSELWTHSCFSREKKAKKSFLLAEMESENIKKRKEDEKVSSYLIFNALFSAVLFCVPEIISAESSKRETRSREKVKKWNSCESRGEETSLCVIFCQADGRKKRTVEEEEFHNTQHTYARKSEFFRCVDTWILRASRVLVWSLKPDRLRRTENWVSLS